jgi:Tfp pilus assembly protein PilF
LYVLIWEQEASYAGSPSPEWLQDAAPADYDFTEPQLNSLGYEMLGEREPGVAARVFERNTVAFPASSNAFDSMGDAYATAGDRPRPQESYRKAVELNPQNFHAKRMLGTLERPPGG